MLGKKTNHNCWITRVECLLQTKGLGCWGGGLYFLVFIASARGGKDDFLFWGPHKKRMFIRLG